MICICMEMCFLMLQLLDREFNFKSHWFNEFSNCYDFLFSFILSLFKTNFSRVFKVRRNNILCFFSWIQKAFHLKCYLNNMPREKKKHSIFLKLRYWNQSMWWIDAQEYPFWNEWEIPFNANKCDIIKHQFNRIGVFSIIKYAYFFLPIDQKIN